MTITANQLKVQGVSLLEQMFQDASELLISVRGKPKYVVMPVEDYEKMRETELDKAYTDVMKDYQKGKYHTSTKKFFEEVGL